MADPFPSAVARLFDDDGQHPPGSTPGESKWRLRPEDRPAPPPFGAARHPAPPAVTPRAIPAPPPTPARRRLLRRPVDPIAAFDRGLNRIRTLTHPRRTSP